MELGMPNLQTYYQRVCVCVYYELLWGSGTERDECLIAVVVQICMLCLYDIYQPFSTFLSATCCAMWEILPSPRPDFIDVGTTIHRHSCNYNKENVLSGKIPIYFAVNL